MLFPEPNFENTLRLFDVSADHSSHLEKSNTMSTERFFSTSEYPEIIFWGKFEVKHFSLGGSVASFSRAYSSRGEMRSLEKYHFFSSTIESL